MAEREHSVAQSVPDALLRRLASDPQDREAYLALHAHYRAEDDFPALVKLLVDWAASCAEPTAASQAYREAGQLAEHELDDPARAEDCYTKAVASDPLNGEAIDALQAMLERAGRLPELGELLEAQLEQLDRERAPAKAVAFVHFRLGELFGKRFERPELASSHYRRAYEADPKLLLAVYEARLIALSRGDTRAAAMLYEREASADPDPERKVALLRELAGQYRALSDRDGAVSALERARALAPGDVELMHALASELLQRSATVDERVRALDLDRVGDLLCDIAHSVGPVEGRVFLASALGHAPWHHRALFELERSTPPDELDSLALHWVSYLTHNPDGDAADERRYMLAGAYRRAGQLQDAIFALVPAAEHGHQRARALLDELREQDAGDDSTGTGSSPAAVAATPRVRPLSEAASARANEVGSGLTSAVEELSSLSVIEELPAVEGAPERVAGPPAAARVAEVEAAAPPAADAKRAPAQVSAGEPAPASASVVDPAPAPTSAVEPAPAPVPGPDRLEQLRGQLSALVRSGKGDTGFELAEEILRAEPANADAYTVAERRYRRERDFRRRAELLLRSASGGDLSPEVRTQRLREAIGLFEGRLADADRALEAYRALLTLAPEKDELQRSMLRLLERSRRWDELVAMLELSLPGQRDTAAKVAVLKRLAEIHRRERKDSAATARVLGQLLELEPDDRSARAALTEELIALARWDEAVALIDRRVRAASKTEQVPLLRQMGELYEQKLRDVEAAYHVYERLLELAPNDGGALERMEAIDQLSGSHERLLTTLERRLAAATPSQAANLLVRMATIAEGELLDVDRAAQYLKRALGHAPSNAQILAALGALYERSGRHVELLALLRERALAERQGKARAELYRRIGRLLADQLQDQSAAAEAFAKVNEAGDDHEAWSFLVGRARDANDAAGLCQALARLTPLETDPGARRGLLLERASLLPGLDRASEAVDPLVQLLIEIDPEDAAARTALGELCASLGDYRGLARVLEAQLQRAPDATQQAAVSRELAELYTTKLPDEARAVRALGLWAKSAPDEPEPLRQLAAHHERRRKYRELLDMLDALARVEPIPAERASALERAALLAHSRLKDEAGAFSRLCQHAQQFATPLPPSLLDLARRLDRVAELCDLCERERRYDEFFGLLRERIGATRDRAAKAELYRRLATALIEHREDDDGALAAYEGLLGVDDDVEALRFVQSWAIRHDDPERLVSALARLALSEPSQEERRDLLYERGRLLLGRLGRPDEAITAFEQAVTIDPAFAPALDELANACAQAGDQTRLAHTLERQLERAAGAADQLALLRRLADLHEAPRGDAKRAAQTLARWAELDSRDSEPLRRLRKRLTGADQASELLRTLDALADREREPAARIEALVAASNLAFDRFGDADGAFARLTPLLSAEQPEVDSTLIRIARAGGKLEELYRRLEQARRFGALVAELETSAGREADPSAAAELLRRAARALHTHLHDEARAEAVYAQLLALTEDAEALRYMQARALERDDPRAMADALWRLAQLERDPRELRELLYDYAHIQNYRLHQPAAALPVLRRVLFELDSEYEPALDEWLSAARAAGDDTALAEALERQLIREPVASARADLAQQLAELYRDRLHDSAARARVLSIWAAEDAHDVIPRRALAALLRERGEPSALLACLDEVARLTDSRSERFEVEREAAELCADALQAPERAFDRTLRIARDGRAPAWVEDALRRYASQSGKLDELTQYYADAERHDEVVALLRERAAREREVSARAELLSRAAEVLVTKLGDEAAAASTYRALLELREDAVALRFLRGIAEQGGDLAGLEQLLRRLTSQKSVAAGAADSERLELLLSRARLLGHALDRPAEGIALLREILRELDPRHAGAAEALIELSERVGDDAALASGLEVQLELADEPAERHALALRLANLYDGPLADAARAAACLRQACDADPDDLDAQRRRRAHLERQEAPAELVAVLDVLSRIEDSQAARDAARLAAARVLHRELGEPRSALIRLSPLIHAAEPQAVHLADEVCRGELGRELAAVYAARAEQSSSLPLTRASWRKVSEIHELWLDEPAEALEATLRLLATEPRNEGYLGEVDRLGKKLGAFDRLEQIYAKLVREADEPVRVELLVRLADMLERDAAQPRAALRHLLAAGKLAPETAGLLAHVERLARDQGAHAELIWAVQQRARLASDPSLAIDAWLEVAQTADSALADRERASLALSQAVELIPRAPHKLGELLPLAATLDRARPEMGAEDAQRGLLRALLDLASRAQPALRVELVLVAGAWLTEQLQDEPGSFDALRLGTAKPPIADRLLEALERTALRLGRLDALNAHLARVAERAVPTDKRALLARRARILEERLKRFDQAAHAYERLLELDPDDHAAEARHFTCLKLAGRHRELLHALERRVQRASEPARRAALMRQIAKIWEVDLKNRASAVVVWSELQALLPQDEEAKSAIARLHG